MKRKRHPQMQRYSYKDLQQVQQSKHSMKTPALDRGKPRNKKNRRRQGTLKNVKNSAARTAQEYQKNKFMEGIPEKQNR
jgi:hypothetical protein